MEHFRGVLRRCSSLPLAWRLGRASLCCLSAAIGASLCLCVLTATQTPPFEYPGESVVSTPFVLQLVLLPLTAAGAGCYVYVAAKASRSARLHAHGATLFVMLAQSSFNVLRKPLELRGDFVLSFIATGFSVSLWGTSKAMLLLLVKQKLMALGPPLNFCVHSRRWSNLAAIFGQGGGLAAAAFYAWAAMLLLLGYPAEAVFVAAGSGSLASGVPMAHQMTMRCLLFGAFGCTVGFVLSSVGVLYCALRMSRRAARKLREREVSEEELARVRSTVAQHLAGALLTIISTQMLMILGFVDAVDQNDDDGQETMVSVLPLMFDTVGDIVGILLLSGIGTLLFREDPEAGDVPTRIRALLHSAVLTARANVTFEGNVNVRQNSPCVVSFPGKFVGDWHSLTWACEQGEIGSACVFLPSSDPQGRFGRHTARAENPDQCWCHSIYGAPQPWGCEWFSVWRNNLHRAMELRLELVVVFFPGELGRGVLDWEDLKGGSLWDGVGLGGSQKAEVGYLRMLGVRVTELDLEAFRRRVQAMTGPSPSRAEAPGRGCWRCGRSSP